MNKRSEDSFDFFFLPKWSLFFFFFRLKSKHSADPRSTVSWKKWLFYFRSQGTLHGPGIKQFFTKKKEMLLSFHCIIPKIIVYLLPQVCLGGHFNFLMQTCYFCTIGIHMASRKGCKVKQDKTMEKLLVMIVSTNCSPECDGRAWKDFM